MPRTSPTIGMSRRPSSASRSDRLVGHHVVEHVLALEDLDRRQRDRRADRVAAEGDPVQVHLACPSMNGAATRSEISRPPIGKCAPVSPLAKVIMSGS